MALNTITLTWDFTNIVQAGATAFLQIQPTTAPDPVVNAAGMTIITGEAVSQSFSGESGQLAGIIACDNAGLSPAGWGYAVKVIKADGTVLYDETVILDFTSGATQDLSQLTPAQPVTQFAAFMLQPSGTATAGDVPVATGTGQASAWTPSGGGGTVASVFGRTGAVAAQPGDYTAAQTGADPAGTATAAAAGALTAAESFATTAVAAETTRAETAEALLAPKASPALTGTPTAPTPAPGDSTTKLATTAFVAAAVVSGQFLRAPSVYAPAVRAPLAITSATMAAFSSGNASTGSFTVPPSGSVLVRATFIASISIGASMAFGLAATGTVTPMTGNIAQFRDSAGSAQARAYVCEWLVTGLTPGNSLSLDLMGCAASGDTVTVYAEQQTSVTPGLSAATDGGPVTMTVQAV